MNELLELAGSFGPRLVWTSLQAAVLVILIMAALKLHPQWPASVRSLLWWLVGLQVIIGLLLPSPIPLPLLQTATTPPILPEVRVLASTVKLPAVAVSEHPPTLPFRTCWIAALVGLWAIVALWKWLQLAGQWRQTRDLVRRAADAGSSTRRLGHEISRRMGLRNCPDIRQSGAIRSPQVSGCLRAVILLPTDHRWSDAELQLVLSHELAHIRRNDLWLGWVMVLAEHLLWFHPLIRRAAREYALNRELACDQLALRAADTAATAMYGRLLLQVSVQASAAGRLMGASDSFLTLRRRLLALQREEGRWGPAAVVALLLALLGSLPYQLTAASVPDDGSFTSTPPITSALPPVAPAAPLPPPTQNATAPPTPPAPPAAAATSSAQVVLSASPMPAWPSPPGAHILAPAYALIVPTPLGGYEESTASHAELSSLQALARQTGQALWWSQRGASGYLVTDMQNLSRLRRIYAPVSQYWTDSSPLIRRYWGARGQLEGLSDWQSSLIAQQQQDLDGTDGPGHAARMRDQQRQLDEIHRRSRVLWRQLDSMREDIAANQRQGMQLMQQANIDAQRLLSQAIADGRARRYDLKQ